MSNPESQKLLFVTTPGGKCALAGRIAAELDKRKIYAAARRGRVDLIAEAVRQLRNKEGGPVAVDDFGYISV